MKSIFRKMMNSPKKRIFDPIQHFNGLDLQTRNELILKKFSTNFAATFNFEDIRYMHEDAKNVTRDSVIFKKILSSDFGPSLKNEIDIEKYIADLHSSTMERSLALLRFFNKFGDLDQRKEFSGIIFNDLIYFDSNSCSDIKVQPNFVYKNFSHQFNDSFCEESFIYKFHENEFKHLIFLSLVADEKACTLNLNNTNEGQEFFSLNKTFILYFERDTFKDEDFVYNAYITDGKTKYREQSFLLNNNAAIVEAVNKMLFPFNLTIEKRNTIDFCKEINFEDIVHKFDDEFQIFEMIEI